MTNLYWVGPKGPKKDVYAALMKELVECTDDAFEVKFGKDGAGAYAAVYVEVETKKRDSYHWKKQLPLKFMGWRLIRIFTPPTSIKILLNATDD